VLTADAPRLGRRRKDVRNRFQLPPGLVLANLSKEPLPASQSDSALANYFDLELDAGLTWKDVEWLAGLSSMPVLVKGLVRGDDAVRAVEHGAAGVVVSNHGGRQLDGSIATLDALGEVAEAVGDRTLVLVDGGVRRGTDVLKALCRGARAVLLGRPVLWGLACAGESGALQVLEHVRAELERAMALCGVARLDELTEDLLAAR
jgi:4-hydroxymandelate oxidase